jgi:hypothetical protein
VPELHCWTVTKATERRRAFTRANDVCGGGVLPTPILPILWLLQDFHKKKSLSNRSNCPLTANPIDVAFCNHLYRTKVALGIPHSVLDCGLNWRYSMLAILWALRRSNGITRPIGSTLPFGEPMCYKQLDTWPCSLYGPPPKMKFGLDGTKKNNFLCL